MEGKPVRSRAFPGSHLGVSFVLHLALEAVSRGFR